MCMLTAIFPNRPLTPGEFMASKMLFANIMLSNGNKSNKDGTGFITQKGRRARWVDDVGTTIMHGDFIEQLQGNLQQGDAIIGHVRAISAGEGSIENTHPFYHRGIALSHNGTFSNYKELLKTAVVDSNDPTDSLVVAHLLGDEVGGVKMTFNHIKTVLDKTTGSYALLLLDIPNNNLWVVRGSSMLYTTKLGPLHIINTSQLSLEIAISNSMVMSKICGMPFWEPSDITSLNVYTAYTLDTEGLHEQGALSVPKPVASKSYYKTSRHIPNNRDETAGSRAKLISDLMNTLDTLSLADVNYICAASFGINWWELPYNLLGAFVSAMLQAHNSTTDKKDELWLHLQKLFDGDATEALDILHEEIELPYYLNSTAVLQKIITNLEAE